MDLKSAIEEFTTRIQTLLESQAMERAKAEILGAFGIGAPRKPGRPSKAASAAVAPAAKTARKKLPPQYCPVPYCRNLAAPVFGQVCAKHKDVPKALIKKYREERRAKKDGVKVTAKKAPRKVARKAAKPPAKKMKTPTKVAKKASKRVAKKAKAAVPSPASSTTPPAAEPAT
jgi:hypothetical protein